MLVPPDKKEVRHGRSLLIWGDLPHWMVVDAEMETFLQSLDGTVSLAARVAAKRRSRRALAKIASDLLGVGVLRDVGAPLSLRRLAAEPKIENLAINLTSRCNLRCEFCYYRDSLQAAPQGEITSAEICRFLNDARPLSAKSASLVILGGEPLLEPEKLLAVAAHARKRGLKCLVSTNGTLVTSALAAEARRLGLEMQVSIDGPDTTIHDAVRGRGSFERAVAGVRALVAARVHTIISMVCHQQIAGRLNEFFSLAANLGVQEARFIPLKRLGGASRSGQRPMLLSRLMHETRTMLSRRPEFLRLMGRDAFSILANTCRYSAKRPSCGTGLQTILLDADGSLYPCLNLCMPEFRIASIRDPDYDLAGMWNRSAVLRQVREDTRLDNAGRACSRCSVRYWCLGGCRGETLALTGDLRAPAANCADLKRAMMDMMWFLADAPELVRPATRIC